MKKAWLIVLGVIVVVVSWMALRPDVIDVPAVVDDERVYPGDEPGTTCELGKTYERSGSHQTGCVCPEGYAFDSTIIGYGPCYGAGSECPILEVTCVQ